ncbi:hypothetical protein ACFOW1_15255 [Parasediminibacterium paludis]|uniref:MG2 domain-containing protein n=1 Tax=Parasediminibacterium paludis TaxID=908966 RepID=A0ABV8Q1F2_9BACT
MKKISLVLAFITISICKLSAQQIDSMMNLYAENYQQEKIHIHFDKSIYNKGETIWYKAYVMTGTDLTTYSKNFYVDWFDDQGKLLSHTAAPMFESSARGQFVVPEKYAGKLIHAKAYTNWMLNFDTAFLYNKDLRIDQSQATTTNKTVPVKSITTVQFLPEAGDLVGGINQRIAFLATNQFGIPVNVVGAIKNTKNELIDSFSTDHDGMGVLSLDVNAKETYTAVWTDENKQTHTTPIPVTRAAAATIQVQPLRNKVLFVIKRSADAPDNFKTLNAIAHINQHEIYKSRVNLSVKTSGVGEIPTADLPSGILQITLFDANWVPIAERVVFVNNNDYEFFPDVRVLEKSTKPRGKNKIDVYVSDTTLSNMSMAVTDAGLLTDNSNTIISQLLLAGDIKGYLHNPAYYFSSDVDSVRQHLDLVMLTHGWRRFNWVDIAKSQPPIITNAKDTDFLQIKGSVFGFNKVSGAQLPPYINLILQAKDSSKQMVPLVSVTKSGNFLVRGVTFYDTIRVYYSFNGDKKMTDRAEVRVNSGLTPAPSKLFTAIASSPLLWGFKSIDSIALARSKFFYNEKLRLDKLLAAANLQEVIVKSTTKSAKDILDEKYASGLFTGGDATQFDVVNDPFSLGAIDVFSYLQGRVAGLQINNNGAETSLSWRGGTPEVFLNEIRSDIDQVKSLPMSDVAYIKVFRPPFFGASGGGAGGAIAIYTRKGGDVKQAPGPGNGGLGYQILAGYTPYKEFYSPNYSVNNNSQPDVRTTLYWNPYILTDKKNKTYKIEFYNNDISKRLRVVLEGINAEGKLTRIEKILE